MFPYLHPPRALQLHLAAAAGHLKMMRVLLEACANVEAACVEGRTPVSSPSFQQPMGSWARWLAGWLAAHGRRVRVMAWQANNI